MPFSLVQAPALPSTASVGGQSASSKDRSKAKGQPKQRPADAANVPKSPIRRPSSAGSVRSGGASGASVASFAGSQPRAVYAPRALQPMQPASPEEEAEEDAGRGAPAPSPLGTGPMVIEPATEASFFADALSVESSALRPQVFRPSFVSFLFSPYTCLKLPSSFLASLMLAPSLKHPKNRLSQDLKNVL